MKLLIACILSLCFAWCACAADSKLSIEAVRAIVDASNKYGIDAQALVKIGYVESRYNQAAIRVNKNHTVDIGMFQVNSVHWSKECKGIDVTTLQGNADCAAKIIAGHAKHAKTDSAWLGRYHSKTISKKLFYSKQLDKVGL